jgi:hypothetical protein
MFQSANYSPESYKTLSLTFVFCLFFGLSVLAQGEKDRLLPDGPKNAESVQQVDAPDGSNDGVNKTSAPVKTAGVAVKKENPIFKQGGEKDAKKEEISTLSFNLFLYIVDKFKED